MSRFLLATLCLILIFSQHRALAQEGIEKDTVIIESEDTVLMKSYAARYDPRKALLYAAVVPGLGQAYNKKYWKLPLVYGGFFAIGLQINNLNNIYTEYKGFLYENLSQPGGAEPNFVHKPTNRTTSNLRRITERSRRDRDFWVIMMGTLYLLQIVDAHVDAHLKEFDLNPNLKVTFQPTVESNSLIGRQTGMSVIVRF